MSTNWIVYLNYMSTWVDESEENINAIIDEHRLYVEFPDSDFTAVLNDEFTMLRKMAYDVRDKTVEADAIQMFADATAVAAVWSFGLGMAEFVAAEAEALIAKGVASIKSAELNKKMASIDVDISAKLGYNVHDYVTRYKANNALIANRGTVGLDERTCRANLLHFLAQVEKRIGTNITALTFRKYATAARQLFESEEISKVYDAMDELALSAKRDEDLLKYLQTVTKVEGSWESEAASDLLRLGSSATLFTQLALESTDIVEISARLSSVAKAAEVGELFGEFGEGFMEAMAAHAKFITCVGCVFAVVDIVFEVFAIRKIIEQTEAMCLRLDGIQANYTDFFRALSHSAKQYREAVSPSARHVAARQAIPFPPRLATLRNFHSGRRLYAQSTKLGEDGVGASEPGGVGPICRDQIWQLKAQADGSFLINNAFSQRNLFAQHGKCWEAGVGASTLDVPGNFREEQRWYLEAQEDGTYIIKNTCSQRRLFAQQGKCWEDGVGASEPGGAGSLCSDQKWYVEALNQELLALHDDWQVIPEA